MKTACEITVQPSGRAFAAAPGETILEAALRSGVALPYGCKDGGCGSCKCRKISGHVTHRARAARALSRSEAADGLVLTCCATAHTPVVLHSRQVTAANALPVQKIPVRVLALQRLANDVMRVDVQLPVFGNFRCHAGQYLEFILPGGARRAYSIASAPHLWSGAQALVPCSTAQLELHIRHQPGGLFTEQVFHTLRARDILRVQGPFGSFFLREDEESRRKPLIFVASGTGFAPIKAILEHMQHAQIQRPATLYWGARRPHDLYLHDWVQAQQRAMPHLRYVPVLSEAHPEDGWRGRTGLLHAAVLDDFADLAGHQVYACGAPEMVEAARRAYTQTRNLDADDFFADAFIPQWENQAVA